jgi:hypothetical protein
MFPVHVVYILFDWRFGVIHPAAPPDVTRLRATLLETSTQADKSSNITKSKYQCPACAARTCSLPCYKRHQQRALCTGKRDPTKYVKKSQLATPAGIDHDFNFITRIERQLEKAEKDVNDKGLGAAPELRRRPRKGELHDHDLNAAGVKVVRAPKGLSRQKENKSHRGNKWVCSLSLYEFTIS